MRIPKGHKAPKGSEHGLPPSDYQALAGSEHPPHPATKRLTAADPKELGTIRIIVRRRPDGPPLKDLDYFQKVPIGSRDLPSRQEFEQRHGATQSDLDAVMEFCRSHHMEVVEANRSRRWVVARATVAQMNSAFAVTLINFQSPHGKYRGFDGAANVPAALAGRVEAVYGLDNRPIPVRRLSADPSPIGFLKPSQVANLYNFPAGTGAGQTIGQYQNQGYGYKPSDVTTTLTNWGVTQTGSVKAFPAGSNTSVSDIETIIDLTPSRPLSRQRPTLLNISAKARQTGDIVNTLQSMIHPANPTDPVPTIISICYAWAADDQTTLLGVTPSTPITSAEYNHISSLFQDAANLLITVLTGSADTGAYLESTKAQTVYPGTDPYILLCGGTSVGNISESEFDEYVWNDTYETELQSGFSQWTGATGGGISAPFSAGTALPGCDYPAGALTRHGDPWSAAFLTWRGTPARTPAML